MTTLADELAKQRLWKPLPHVFNLAPFDELVRGEFLSPEAAHNRLSRLLAAVVRFAVGQVPFYESLFARLGLSAQDVACPEDLIKLPVLGKRDVIEHEQDLRARQLPPDEKVFGPTRSSGTTGRPVTVHHSNTSTLMYSLLGSRHARWYGFDPAGTMLDVRSPGEVARNSGGSPLPKGQLARRPRWRYQGQFFHTGPEFGFGVNNPMEQQVDWLRQLRPHYAQSYPGVFEEWLLACDGRPPVDSFRGLICVGTQLPPSLRRRLEGAYQIPIHQGYGLNEIGRVAVRCEAGRYHVHSEHCLVEVVGDDGRPCAAGQTGRLLVTALRNLAMPLLRYDTGDLAEAAAGPCPCGSTLPSFAEIAGRYRRFAGLPPGKRERVTGLQIAFEGLSPADLAFLRRYQIHQDRQNRFELRLRVVAPIPYGKFEPAGRPPRSAPSTPTATAREC